MTTRASGERRDYEVAWAAGFLDGEGHFGSKTRLSNGHRLWLQAVQVASREPLDRLARLFGGRIIVVADRRPGHRTRFQWTLHGAPLVGGAIREMLPYLTVKRDEAVILLAIAELTPRRGCKLCPEDAARRVELDVALKAARG